MLELFATAEAVERHPDLTAGADEIDPRDAAALSETVTPQGLVAVCRLTQPPLAQVLATSPGLLCALVEPGDPGNLGTIVRTADAAGADAVLLAGGVDPLNGKAVRAGAGSLFHLPVVSTSVEEILAAGPRALAATGHADLDLDDLEDQGGLVGPTTWLFGNEAHGLPDPVVERADLAVRVPVHGRAESLNLAAAAAVCLYASARAQRRR